MDISEDKSIAFQSLEAKVKKSREVILEAERRFGKDRIATTFTGGKDSTTLLHIIRQTYQGVIPFKVFNIDTSVKFREIYDFRDRIAGEWSLDLIVLRNDKALQEIVIAKDKAECCLKLKAEALNEGIRQYNIRAVLTGIRWDEQVSRADEKYFSDRGDHSMVNPILHFMEKDIWEYIRTNRMPYCELYDRGFRSLGCEPCTRPDASNGPERGGRNRDKEVIMRELRDLGYF